MMLEEQVRNKPGGAEQPSPEDNRPMSTPVVTLDSACNVCIPAETAAMFGLHAGSKLAVSVKNGGIMLIPLLAGDLDELHGIFARSPGMEQDLDEMRREEEERSERKLGW